MSDSQKFPSLLLEVLDEQEDVELDLDDVRTLSLSILETAGVTAGRIEVVIATDEMVHELNRQFLQHDYPTDVISFAIEADLSAGYLEGSVIVSGEMARSRAPEFGTSPATECMLYIVHGLLHLVGFDDHDPEERYIMRRREREVLLTIGIDLTGTHYDQDAQAEEVLRN
ncbi:MAG: rRNA maturation RNase YbeY [Thermoguttaceae bacterium]